MAMDAAQTGGELRAGAVAMMPRLRAQRYLSRRPPGSLPAETPLQRATLSASHQEALRSMKSLRV